RNVFRAAIAYGLIAWVLMQVGDTLAPALRLPEWTTSLLAFFLILGFPLAVFFAWTYEMTPEGLRPEGASSDEGAGRPIARRQRGLIIAAAIAVGLGAGYLAYDGMQSRDSNPPAVDDSRRPIAVLPFESISTDPDQEVFADGLTIELINLLTRIREFRVTSRPSAFYYKGKDYRIVDVGAELRVDYVLEGSVRKYGDQVRISAQLVDVARDEPVWTDSWQRTFESIFDIQDEIAAAVTKGLEIRLVDGLPTTYVTDPHAYELYLRAALLWDDYSQQSLERALNLLEQVLAIDPNYAPALAHAGQTALTLGAWNFRPLGASFEQARNYGHRAIAADPDYDAGYVLLGSVAGSFDQDAAAARRYFERALELQPASVDARLQLAFLELVDGETRPMVEAARAKVATDPLSAPSFNAYGHALMFDRQYAAALEAYERLHELNPDAIAINAMLGEILFLLERHDEALAVFENEVIEGFRLFGRAIVFHEQGLAAESDAALAALIGMDNEEWAAQIAQAHAVRGEIDEAMRWLYLGLERRDQGIQIAAVNPFLDNLRGDERFAEFLVTLRSGKDAQ
ncbi:MAG: hypothetical protein R3315_03300, partial [Woeseiaceae bacterium]|nr:hypothetical protein [Woeseiaceae bacterium]